MTEKEGTRKAGQPDPGGCILWQQLLCCFLQPPLPPPPPVPPTPFIEISQPPTEAEAVGGGGGGEECAGIQYWRTTREKNTIITALSEKIFNLKINNRNRLKSIQVLCKR
jgi:hypothetical protein